MAVRLVEPEAPDRRENVLIVHGYPWHASEDAVLRHLARLYPTAAPTSVRLYDNPVNGASRGIGFVEYAEPAGGDAAALATQLAQVQQKVEGATYEGAELRAVLYHLTATKWDRGGRLPDLPGDPPPLPRGGLSGYGERGYLVRGGPALGLPNTLTEEGIAKMRSLRKRLRAHHSPSSSSSEEEHDHEEE